MDKNYVFDFYFLDDDYVDDANYSNPNHYPYSVSKLYILRDPENGLNVQNIVIILYKIWQKSWFVSGFFLFVLRTILLFIKVFYTKCLCFVFIFYFFMLRYLKLSFVLDFYITFALNAPWTFYT